MMLIRVQKIVRHLIVCALLAIVAPVCFAADSVGEPGRDSKGPNPLRNVYFGEQHLHTQNSPDAFVVNTRGTWEDAYNYAMGNEITLSTTGEKIRKTTPYDFVGITDHSEYFGVMPSLIDPDDPLYESELGKQMRDPNMNPSAPDSPINQILSSIITNVPMKQFVTPALQQANWARYIETANKFNQPGKFTTLIAYEWTSIPNGRNMHRNVYWRGDAPAAPFSSFDSIYPQDLWTYMEFNRNVGLESIAIPHNANVSDGWMFSHNTFLGGPMDARHAFRQQANEPVMEIIQTKGQSEAHPAMSPNDEFAEFEMFPNMINVAQPSQINYGYMRQGLAEGMILEEKLGTNPFKYGIVAGADSHSAYSNNEEWGFHGSHGVTDDTPAKRLAPGIQPSGDRGVGVGSAGATAVWAEENTREAIFDAMKRRETYGTSGPLMRVRFFGGWDFDGDLVEDDDFVEKAYEDGVPMGGDLPARPERARAPTFAVWAMKEENLRRGAVRRALGGPGHGQGAAGRRHGGCGYRDLHQRHRRHSTQRRVDRPRLRPEPTGTVLRARDRDSDTALVDLRRRAQQSAAAAEHADHPAGARLVVADLVYPGRRLIRERQTKLLTGPCRQKLRRDRRRVGV
jgi:hypothetical protein